MTPPQRAQARLGLRGRAPGRVRAPAGAETAAPREPGRRRAAARGSPARPSPASRPGCRVSRTDPRSTSTTPTASGCRSCSPRPASAPAAPARSSSPPAGSRSTARSSPSSACGSTRAGQVVHVDGIRVSLDESRVYLAFNKPLGVVSTMNDELGRPSPRRLRRRPRTSGCSTSAASTPTPRACCCSPTTATSPTGCSTRRTAWPRPTSRRSPARCPATSASGCATGVELEDGPAKVDSFKVVDTPARQGAGRGRASTRAASTSCAGCSTPSDTRSSSLVRTQVGPIRLGDLKSGRTRRAHARTRSASSTQPAGHVTPVTRGHVRVVGTGLIGTSLGIALCRAGFRVTLHDPSPTAARLARDLGAGEIAAASTDDARPRRRRRARPTSPPTWSSRR